MGLTWRKLPVTHQSKTKRKVVELQKLRDRFKKSRDAKVLSENFLSLSALKIIGYVFPLITLPYLARTIGVEKFGEIAYAAAIVVYFQTIVDFGFNYSGVRDIARVRDNKNKVSEIFFTVMAAKIMLMIISLIILIIFIQAIPAFGKNRLILLLTFLYIPGYLMFPDWFFQAMEEMKYITFLDFLSKLIFTVLVFIVIREKEDYIFQPVLTASGYFTSGIISIILIIKKYRLKFYLPRLSDIRETLSESRDIFISLFLPNLYTNFSIILLRNYFGTTATGIYSAGSKFLDIFDQLAMVLSRTFYPFLSRRPDKHPVYVAISLTFSIISCLLLFFGAGILVNVFYTDEFGLSKQVIRIMAVCPLFLFLMNTYGPNYLVLIGKEHILRNIITICSVAGFILSWFMVSKYSYMGVAITITLIWGVRGLLTWLYAVRQKK